MVIYFAVWVKRLQLCVVSPSAYSHSDADVLNQSLLEANIATEVCLTVLDTLSVFIMSFKVTLQTQPGSSDRVGIGRSLIVVWIVPADPAVPGPRPQPADEEGV